MSYRPLAALGLAGLIVLACVSLSKAAPEPDGCDTKEMVAADVMKRYPKAVILDVQGDEERAFLAELSNLAKKDLNGTDAVIYQNPDFNSTLVILFKDGCGHLKGEFPNEVVKKLLGVEA